MGPFLQEDGDFGDPCQQCRGLTSGMCGGAAASSAGSSCGSAEPWAVGSRLSSSETGAGRGAEFQSERVG